jgi:hypothetical protein
MRKLVVAVLVLAGCASTAPVPKPAQVKVVVSAGAPLRQSDADLFRRVTQSYVQRYVHDGQPLTVSIALGEGNGLLADREASQRNYWTLETGSFGSYSGHAVPLVGGMNAMEVGFSPTVGGSVTGGYAGAAGVSYAFYDRTIMARYTITDAAGNVLETNSIPMDSFGYTTPYVGLRMQSYHDTGMYIAKQVARREGR